MTALRGAFLLGAALVAGCAAAPRATPGAPPGPPLTFGADAHVHVTMRRAATPLFQGEPGRGALATSPGALFTNTIDTPALRAAGVRLVLAALWPPIPRPGRSALDETRHQLHELHAFASEQPDFAVVHDVAEARRILGQGRLALWPQIEGAEGVTRVEDVDLLWAAGARVVQLVHFTSTQLGGAARGQTGRAILGLRDDRREPLGLTPLGAQVVRRLVELGVVIDLAHASDQAIADVLAITTPRGVPVLVSHTGARALMPDLERSLSDENARQVVAGGGLVGVILFEDQLQVPPTEQRPGHVPGTCDDVVAHWRHFASVVGPEHLLLGSDLNSIIRRSAPGGACAQGLRHAGDLPALWGALAADGIPRATLDDMGARLLELFERVEAHADPAAQSQARQRAREAARPVPAFDVP